MKSVKVQGALHRKTHMKYIYFDESGDLGFDFAKRGVSKYFSMAFIILENPRPITTLARKVSANLPPRKRKTTNGVLHAYFESNATRCKLLSGLATKQVKIATIRIFKQKNHVRSTPHNIYSRMVAGAINCLVSNEVLKNDEDVRIIASRRNTSKVLNRSFKESITRGINIDNLQIDITKPFDDKCLQVADFVSWAFWQKYEKGDATYSDLLAKKIIGEYEMK